MRPWSEHRTVTCRGTSGEVETLPKYRTRTRYGHFKMSYSRGNYFQTELWSIVRTPCSVTFRFYIRTLSLEKSFLSETGCMNPACMLPSSVLPSCSEAQKSSIFFLIDTNWIHSHGSVSHFASGHETNPTAALRWKLFNHCYSAHIKLP